MGTVMRMDVLDLQVIVGIQPQKCVFALGRKIVTRDLSITREFPIARVFVIVVSCVNIHIKQRPGCRCSQTSKENILDLFST